MGDTWLRETPLVDGSSAPDLAIQRGKDHRHFPRGTRSTITGLITSVVDAPGITINQSMWNIDLVTMTSSTPRRALADQCVFWPPFSCSVGEVKVC